MGKKIQISRHGLTRCPTCTSHIRVIGSLDETSCPFCEASFPTSWFAGKPSPGKGISSLSRAIVMASMLGLPFAGCSEEEKPKDAGVDAVYDQSMQPAYGVPMDWVEPSPDEGAQPEYGIPMDIVEPSPDEGPQPEYGIPMDVVEPAADEGFQPEYGIPMDMVEPSPDEGFEPDYGLPPDAE